MKITNCFVLATLAGTLCSSVAMAQKSAAPTKATKSLAGRMVSEVPQRAPAPDRIRSVRIENGRIVGASEWRPYTTGGSNPMDAANEYVFDSVQDAPSVVPGTLPTSGRYTFYLETAGDAYTMAIATHDMASIPAGAWGQGAKVADFMIREQQTQPLFVTLATAETYDGATNPLTSATWGVFPGIQLEWAAGIGVGFWFTSADVTTQAPPLGDGWKMPTDGAGAYILVYTRDAAGTVPAMSVQPGRWGTGATAQPPVARVGTAGLNGHVDESDGTPANCGPALLLLTQNTPDLIIQPTCEQYAWGPFAVPAPATTTLQPAVGFGMKLNSNPGPVCYANCDNSTNTPCLNVQDFGCFLNAFSNNESYANCDGSTNVPVLNVQDFGCFLNAFSNGCSSCV